MGGKAGKPQNPEVEASVANPDAPADDVPPQEAVPEAEKEVAVVAPAPAPAQNSASIAPPIYASPIKAVSLGSSVLPRMAIDRLDCSADAGKLPFDWISTRVEGLLQYLQSDFQDFFSFATSEPVKNSSAVMYRDYLHAFWHDNPTEVSVHEDFKRRIHKFFAIKAVQVPVLFVRAAATTKEVMKAEELLRVLTDIFGPNACLLQIVDGQTQVQGAGLVADQPRLLTYSLATDAHMKPGELAYEKPIRCALEWANSKPIDAMTFPDVATYASFLQESAMGLAGLGGLSAFEDSPCEKSSEVNAPDQEAIANLIEAAKASGIKGASYLDYKGKSRNPMESEALELVHGAMPAAETISDGVALVSLGCYCGTKLTFQKLGRGAATLPFDWIRTTHESLINFMRSGFEGFYDVQYQEEVPGVPGMIMYRGQQHSFWHDDPSHPETREKYDRRIARFHNLGDTCKTVLCVRAVATTDEILVVDELVTELKKIYGDKVCLCLVLSFQTSYKGAYFVEGNEDVLAFFQNSKAFAGDNAKAPFLEAVETAIRWARGEQIEAGCVPSTEELAGLADETHWGYVGLGGLAAFEDPKLAPRPRNPNSKADDNIEQVVAKVEQKFKDGVLVTENAQAKAGA
eukprot:CAMPEP_0178436566 /NCGR_PEP_ID=MMETSP0689_2-20121128/34506_1 /TAXON_ID=160604 /ORGANISM="Amphidinium massartii, Strain CS-259" /LENGTH=629 /DNA_ID=CAMNT_0020058667 /DNA_START=30 /DNA_END=1919 /DNA_ORIENTATION=+